MLACLQQWKRVTVVQTGRIVSGRPIKRHSVPVSTHQPQTKGHPLLSSLMFFSWVTWWEKNIVRGCHRDQMANRYTVDTSDEPERPIGCQSSADEIKRPPITSKVSGQRILGIHFLFNNNTIGWVERETMFHWLAGYLARINGVVIGVTFHQILYPIV